MPKILAARVWQEKENNVAHYDKDDGYTFCGIPVKDLILLKDRGTAPICKACLIKKAGNLEITKWD